MEIIRDFKNLGRGDVTLAGGKGASLGEMTQAGIPVPDGFVILSSAFEKFLEETDLSVEISSILHSVNHREIHTVENASKKIKSLIISKEIPEDIKGDIQKYFKKLNVKFVAVRSSATAEDSSSAAWAGQLDSFLNTTKNNLLENVKKCWASLFTPRAIFYRFEKGLHKQKISVAVVVQKMVDSEFSGIAFSVHPITQDDNQLVIEAGFGLGEAIVSGQVTPDSYVVEKKPLHIFDTNINTQLRGLYRNENGGNRWQKISRTKGESRVLSYNQIIKLSKIILSIEKHYNFPCDIEWAFEKGVFYITQSRPITTLNVIEKQTQDKSLDIERLARIKWKYIHKRKRTPFYAFLLWDGITNHYNKTISFPYEMRNWLALDGDLMVEEKEYLKVQQKAILIIKKDPQSLLDIIHKAYNLDKQIVKFVKKIEKKIYSYSSQVDKIEKQFKSYVEYSLRASAFMLFPMFLENYLEDNIKKSVIKRFAKQETEKVMQTLTTPVKPSALLEEEINLLQLAIEKRNNKSVDKEIDNLVANFAWLKNNTMDGSYYSDIDYRQRINTFTKEQPKNKLTNLRKSQKEHIDLVGKYKKILGKQTAVLIDTLLEAIYFRSWRTERMYRNIQYLKNFIKLIAERIGLETTNDIFYLLPSEISALLRRNEKANIALIAERKNGFILFADGRNTQIYSGDVVTEAKSEINYLGLNKNTDKIKGRCAFPGKVMGKVCLILSKNDFAKMIPDGILVSRSTTPDYTPVIKKAKAIITDEGGVLSHASVISRELKIPCIIGTINATTVLKDNDLVEIDAEKGIIKII